MPPHAEAPLDRKTAIPFVTLAAGFLLALVITAWEFVGLRLVDRDNPVASLESPPVPWGGLAGREAARLLENRWRLDPLPAAPALLSQLGHYPLDPWRWLLYSRIDWFQQHDPSRLREQLATAIGVQPRSRELRWQAANLAQSTGDADLVLDQLALWVADAPRDSGRALFIGSRWVDDPGELLDRILPGEEAFLIEAMRYALRSHSMALAEAVWQRLDQPRAADDQALADYVATALNTGRPQLAMAAWQASDPRYRPGDVPAGHFGLPLEAMTSFAWNLSMRDGASVELLKVDDTPVDENGGAARGGLQFSNALRIAFDGEHNIQLSTPFVRFPVPEPGRYRLSGWWRAQGLTTRSLPFLQLYAESSEHAFSETRQIPGAEFDWQRFEIEFEVVEPNEIFRLRLRRNRTEAFDRYIEGQIDLAGLGVDG